MIKYFSSLKHFSSNFISCLFAACQIYLEIVSGKFVGKLLRPVGYQMLGGITLVLLCDWSRKLAHTFSRLDGNLNKPLLSHLHFSAH